MNVRPELPSDYANIARTTIRAFGERLAEAQIIALLRQRCDYDPALSLVAEEHGEIVGHILFTPCHLRLMGETVRAVILAPVSVDPAWQKQGIGGALIEAGHAIAREKGAALSLLIGHPTYYPRFGYRTNAYGGGALGTWSAKADALVSRPLAEADLPRLHELWLMQEGDVDFAIEPTSEMVDWLSPNPAVRATVYERDGRVVGYSRAHGLKANNPAYFLAEDVAAARSMIWMLAGGGAMVSLPIHPASSWAQELGPAGVEAWEPAMVCPLADSPFEEYERQVKAGARPAGRLIWGTAFDSD